MALLSGRSFSLNPNAPIFIPSALRNVEDFSPEWWKLVKTSRWFQDYWLSQHEEDDFDSIIDDFDSVVDNLGTAEELLELVEALFEEMILPTEAGEKPSYWTLIKTPGSEMDAKKVLKDLVIPKSPKKRDPKSLVGPAKYNNKPAKCASPKCSPRFIHQPR